jgi:hypothetical protein
MKIEPLFHINGYKVLQPEDATKLGYESLTVVYKVDYKNPIIAKSEKHLWDLQCETVRGCDCVVVLFPDGFEMWRHTSQLNLDYETGLKCSRY